MIEEGKMLTTKILGKNQRNDEGFTLLELIIVIVVIGILAAIAIPIYGKQQKAAAFASTKSDVKNIATMAIVHKTKNGLYPRTCAEWKTVIPAGWKSGSSGRMVVKTTANGVNLWVESQPDTAASMQLAEQIENTAIYDSSRTVGVLPRVEFGAKFGYSLETNMALASGYPGGGYYVDFEGTCTAWF
jgi:prepilin-type N-terminal cleavage/methylation domain-containing protein